MRSWDAIGGQLRKGTEAEANLKKAQKAKSTQKAPEGHCAQKDHERPRKQAATNKKTKDHEGSVARSCLDGVGLSKCYPGRLWVASDSGHVQIVVGVGIVDVPVCPVRL